MRLLEEILLQRPKGVLVQLSLGNTPFRPLLPLLRIGGLWGIGFLVVASAGGPVALGQSLDSQSNSGQSVVQQVVQQVFQQGVQQSVRPQTTRETTREINSAPSVPHPLGVSKTPQVRSGPPLPQQATLPPVPKVRTPTDRFRELLAANLEQRETLLSRKTPAARTLIEAKLREFGALRPDEREIRLRLAQFQDSLRTLLPMPPTERGSLMAVVPDEDLPWIEERLAAWDLLPEAERRDVLESERRLSWFVRQAEVSSDRQRVEAYMATLTPSAQKVAREQMERWLALPLAERSRKAAAFSRFFDLTVDERQAALGTLSQTERHQMEQALSDFAALTPDARERCVRGFQKFEALSPADREQFLRRAERWKAMSPNDRAAWRRLVEKALTSPRKPPFPAEETMLASPPR